MGRWQAEEEHLLRLLVPTNTHAEIAEQFKRKYEAGNPGFHLPRTYDAVRKKCKRDNLTSETVAEYGTPFDDRWKYIQELSNQYKLQSESIDVGLIDKPTRKILSLADFHIPFAQEDHIKEAIDTHSDANVCVLGGDLLDGYAFSRWGRARRIAAIYEYVAAFEIIEYCANTFEKVVLLEGNHERRVAKCLARNEFDVEQSQILKPDLLARIANGERLNKNADLVEKVDFSNVHYDPYDSWYERIGKTIFCHPDAYMCSRQGETVNKMAEYFEQRLGISGFDSVVMGHCFDDETEILTQDGWKGIDDISEKDTVGTMNKKTNGFEWNPVENVWRYEHDADMFYIGIDNGRQVAVTPQHGMIWKKQNASDWEYTEAQEIPDLKTNFCFPTALTETTHTDYNNISDEQLQLLAWVVTEGCFEHGNDKSGRCTYVRLSQSEDKNNYPAEIDQLLSTLNMSYSKTLQYEKDTTVHGTYRNYDAYRWYLHLKTSKWIFDFLEEDKTFKQNFLLLLSQRQRVLLIDTLCKGDGSKCGSDEFRHYYTNNPRLRDQVQMLLSISGYSSTFGMSRKEVFYISFKSRSESYIGGNNITQRHYNGRTFCLTVPNGTLLVRRKGWTFVTQNTHRIFQGIVMNKLLIEQGALSGRMPYQNKSDLRYPHSMNGYAVIYQDEEGNTDFNSSHVVYLGNEIPPKKEIL